MANIRFYGVPEGIDFYGKLKLELNAAKTKAVYTDVSTGAEITIRGENLKVLNLDGNRFLFGDVDAVQLGDAEGRVWASFDGHYDARLVSKAAVNGTFAYILKALGKQDDHIVGSARADALTGWGGDDVIVGGGGSDQIAGVNGDDRLTGGTGSDIFVFADANARDNDVITDFDTKGQEVDHLLFEGEFRAVARADRGRDTLLTFEDGATVQLEGVTKAEFVAYWDAQQV